MITFIYGSRASGKTNLACLLKEKYREDSIILDDFDKYGCSRKVEIDQNGRYTVHGKRKLDVTTLQVLYKNIIVTSLHCLEELDLPEVDYIIHTSIKNKRLDPYTIE